MFTNAKWLVLCVLAIGATGCVSQVQYDRLQEAYRTSMTQNTELTSELESQRAMINALRRAQGGDSDVQARLAEAMADKERLEKQIADLEQRIRAMGGDVGPLPAALNDELAALAAANPGLITFDQRRGMVRFASDLTFDLGSTDVRPAAVAALSKFAAILGRPEASRYEALIVGHTDNVRISRPDTRAKHPTNWHLSVHRSISVKDVLEKAGVPAARMQVAGYGQYRPIVPNGARGAEQNRRVEIFLVASTATGFDAGPTVDAPDAAAPAAPVAAPRAPTRPVEAPETFK